MSHEEDRALLKTALEKDEIPNAAREAFEDMLMKLGRLEGLRPLKRSGLTEKQRAWARAVVNGEKYDPNPEYKNEWSSGKIPRGREVPTPPQLLPENLPKRPPTRRSDP